jgi:hypothetical protein
MMPTDAVTWLDKEMREYFPLGVFRDIRAKEKQEIS